MDRDMWCVIIVNNSGLPVSVMGPYKTRNEANAAREGLNVAKYWANVTRMDTELPT